MDPTRVELLRRLSSPVAEDDDFLHYADYLEENPVLEGVSDPQPWEDGLKLAEIIRLSVECSRDMKRMMEIGGSGCPFCGGKYSHDEINPRRKGKCHYRVLREAYHRMYHEDRCKSWPITAYGAYASGLRNGLVRWVDCTVGYLVSVVPRCCLTNPIVDVTVVGSLDYRSDAEWYDGIKNLRRSQVPFLDRIHFMRTAVDSGILEELRCNLSGVSVTLLTPPA